MKSCLVLLALLAISTIAPAQIGPVRARPINGATKPLPMMLIEQKPRAVVIDVFVDSQGRVTSTAIITSSGNGVFDERMRGYWKDTPFMPALDDHGKPTHDTLRVTNTFSIEDQGSLLLRKFRNHSGIDGNTAEQNAARIERMSCGDLSWEYDFMKKRAPKAKLEHEDVFHVAFAMYLAAGNVNAAARDAHIGEWSKLVERVLAGCREKPGVPYWEGVFVPVFTRAAPFQSTPVD
jgi:hypothetical protein